MGGLDGIGARIAEQLTRARETMMVLLSEFAGHSRRHPDQQRHRERRDRTGRARIPEVRRGAWPAAGSTGPTTSRPTAEPTPSEHRLRRTDQAVFTLPVVLCASSTNLRATPESNSAYPSGASSRPITVALTASPMCTLSCRIAFIRPR